MGLKVDVPWLIADRSSGGVAQLGERLLCKQEVDGSIPFTSTSTVTSAGTIAVRFGLPRADTGERSCGSRAGRDARGPRADGL